MSKIIVVIYSFLILFNSFNINLEDFSRLGALWEHAKYHKITYGDSFLDFLSEHYGSKMVTHEHNHDGHDHLPFKDHNHMLCHLNVSFILTPHLIYTVYHQAFIENPTNFFYKEPFSNFEKPSFFQPPKIA